MKEINELLKKYNIKYTNIYKKGTAIIVNNKYVVKKNDTNLYEYLYYRNFNYFPKTIVDDNYEISEFINEIEIPEEQKMLDLINVASILHKKTTYYKKILDINIKEIYDNIKKDIMDINKYYDGLINLAETSIYMSPSLYLLARNISFIYKHIYEALNSLELWYKKINEEGKVRVAVIHNNLSLNHFINNNIISWNKAKIGLPVYDLVKLYEKTYNTYEWYELINVYEKNYLLREEEKILFKILISIPKRIELNSIEMNNVMNMNEQLNYLKLTDNFISNLEKEFEK